MASILIFLAALRYFMLSSLKLLLIELIWSSESPLHSKSSMFLVMIRVTSCRSLFSLSRFDEVGLDEAAAAAAEEEDSAERESRYTRLVFCRKVSAKKEEWWWGRRKDSQQRCMRSSW
jgi:hypothetical protein